MSSDPSDRSPDEQRVVPPADGQRVDHAQKSRRWVRMIKVSVRLLVLGLVGWGIWRTIEQAGEGLQNRDFSVRQVNVTWMAMAGLFYVAGLVPCWVFWHRTLWPWGSNRGGVSRCEPFGSATWASMCRARRWLWSCGPAWCPATG